MAKNFQAQRQSLATRMLEEGDGSRRPVLVNEAESPLFWLLKRKDAQGNSLISAEEYEAGERLRRDFTLAGLTPSVTAHWGDRLGGGGRRRSGLAGGQAELQAAVIAAKDRLQAAFAAVGPELAGVMMEVCCLANGLEAAERRLGFPARSGKVVLHLALTRLARHYGLLADPAAAARPRPLRHWGAADYRPEM
ncbi:hypothetical protein FHS85_002089 [Rhodoligotrophos appendicifer]